MGSLVRLGCMALPLLMILMIVSLLPDSENVPGSSAAGTRSTTVPTDSGIRAHDATDVEIGFRGDRVEVRPGRVPTGRDVSFNLAASPEEQVCVVQSLRSRHGATVAVLAPSEGESIGERHDPLPAGRYVVLCARDGGSGPSGAEPLRVG